MNGSEKIIMELKIKKLIDLHFIKLNIIDKKIISEYLHKTVCELSKYHYNIHFVEQMQLNNCRDILSLLVLLLPYFDLLKCSVIENLNEIFNNSNKTSKQVYQSTYYIDHENINITEYFINSFNLIKQTFYKVNNKLLTNWINIFPYTLHDYKESPEFINFNKLLKNKSFSKFNCKIGYDTIYGTCKQFLYDDIKQIKWMIYDTINENNYTIPYIIWLCDYLKIYNITFENLKELQDQPKKYAKVMEYWNRLNNETNILKIKSLLLFYYNYKKPKVNDKIEQRINNFFNKNKFDDNTNDDEFEFYDNSYSNEKLRLMELFREIQFDNMYNYIYECVLKLKYTWYGNICINNKLRTKKDGYYFLNVEEYNNYFNGDFKHLTLKTYYNYFKSLLNYQDGEEFKAYSNSSDWNELTDYSKECIFNKLNSIEWFNIKGNLKRLYTNLKKEEIQLMQENINNDIINNINKNITVVIFETLVVNGIFTRFIFNPINTDKQRMPDREKNTEIWKQYIIDNLFYHNKQNKYIESYNFINNQQLTKENFNIMMETNWFNNFGSDWICQIQQFHHFIHNRVMFVTGATGAGKSTVYPKIMLYAQKILNYNNFAVIICTQPKILPTKNNAIYINKSVGMGEEIIQNKMNYIQYQTSESKEYIDNEPHLTLRFMTDGSLLSILQKHYILKAKINNNLETKNIIDMILIDESHENNVNMNIILTLLKFATYINNQIILCIVSATMEEDEIIYRKFYELIDDNYKYPLSVYNRDKMKENILYNRKYMDRRIHMSAPFQTTNFSIERVKYNPAKTDPIQILLKDILPKSDKGDILIFQNGGNEIEKMVDKLNNILPNDILAIPYYTTLNEQLKKTIAELGKDENRKKLNFKKDFKLNKFSGDDTFRDLTKYSKIPYKQFVIVATNIAEASITIGSLSYVIDTGEHKKNIFDYNSFSSKLKVLKIAKPNADQRRGRVGRTKKGYFYTTYDYSKLDNKIKYPITSEEIIDNIINLITTETNKIFNKSNDPNLLKNISALMPCIVNQYIYNNKKINNNKQELFNYPKKDVIFNVQYPYIDGGYDIKQLIDEEGIFYIISPNEDMIERDDTLKIIKRHENYINKVDMIINNLKNMNVIDKYNILTNYGKTLLKIKKLFVNKNDDTQKGDIDLIDIVSLIHSSSFRKFDKNKTHKLEKAMFIKIIFTSNSRLEVPKSLMKKKSKIKCDFLYYSTLIKNELYEPINIINNQCIQELFNKKEIEKIDKDIVDMVKLKITQYYNNKKLNKKEKEEFKYYEDVLIKYHMLMIKFDYVYNNKELFTIDTNIFDTSMNYLEVYDLFSYLLIKYYSNNLLHKIKNTPLYINYYNPDLTNLYIINNFEIYNKTIYTTVVDEMYRQQFIFYLSHEENKIKHIMFISNNVIQLIKGHVTPYNREKLKTKNYLYNKINTLNEKYIPYISNIIAYN